MRIHFFAACACAALLALCHCGLGARAARVPTHASSTPSQPATKRVLQEAVPRGSPAGSFIYWGSALGVSLVPDEAKRDVVAIAAGYRHCVALRANGTLVVWGDNAVRQTDVPDTNGVAFTAISAGKFHTLALLANGSCIQWGRDESDSPPLAASADVVSVHAGDDSSFAVLRTGIVLGWGEGLGSIAPLLPTLPGAQVQDIITTRRNGHLVLFKNGTLLNYTKTTSDAVPARPSVTTGVTTMSASVEATRFGGPHFLLRMADGSVLGWGDDAEGQVSGPAALRNVTAATTGRHSLVLLSNGTVRAFGLNSYGQVNVPAAVLAGSPVIAVSAGENHSMALLANGTVAVWGVLRSGQHFLPPALQGPVQAISVAAGYHHSLVALDTGEVVAAGLNFEGETDVPPQVATDGAVAVAAGRNHSLALLQSGRVVSFGALPDGGVPAAARQGVTAIAAGWGYSAALLANGSLVVWGEEPARSCGVLEPPAFDPHNVTAISAGERHMLALLSDGSVRAWGCNEYRQASVPPGLGRNVRAIAAGANHSIVRVASGQVVGFGDNEQQQIRGVSVYPDARFIAAGPAGSLIQQASMVSVGTIFMTGEDPTPLGVVAPAGGTLLAASVGYKVVLGILSIALPVPEPGAAQRASAGGLHTAAIAGVSAGVGVAMVSAGLAGFLWWRRKHAPPQLWELGEDTTNGVKALGIEGLALGDAFVHTTAKEYTWAEPGFEAAQGDELMVVEADVSDVALDALSAAPGAPDALQQRPCPVMKLTSAQVVAELRLLPDGLVGRGATSLAFKCVWSSRFGNALLAAKVLTDGADPTAAAKASFAHEAAVLSCVCHPNVVRLYGYCLEPPTVCLILELLPCSLKDLLHRQTDALGSPSLATSTAVTSSSGQAPKSVSSASRSLRLVGAGRSRSRKTGQGSTSSGSTRLERSGALLNTGAGTQNTVHTTQSSTSTPSVTASLAARGRARLSMLQVLQISVDIAAGLEHLHATPQVPEEGMVEGPEGSEDGEGSAAEHGSSATADPQPCVPPSPARSDRGRTTRIVHRDLKPANILLSRTGVAKISDFGLARQHDNTTVVTDVVAGTLPYMAPELLVGGLAGPVAQRPTNRVDVYSLGVMMWEMLSGRQPWGSLPAPAVMAAVLGGKRPELLEATSGTGRATAASGGISGAISGQMMGRPTSSGLPRQGTEQHQTMHGGSADTVLPWLASLPPVQLSQVPAALDAMPELNSLIRMCWAHRELRRPTAKEVHEALKGMLRRHHVVPDTGAGLHT